MSVKAIVREMMIETKNYSFSEFTTERYQTRRVYIMSRRKLLNRSDRREICRQNIGNKNTTTIAFSLFIFIRNKTNNLLVTNRYPQRCVHLVLTDDKQTTKSTYPLSTKCSYTTDYYLSQSTLTCSLSITSLVQEPKSTVSDTSARRILPAE
ncbi:hypothetical protein EDC96DRAFT_550432 [Choanephora cucurbitarum]|nr:hypothetical protein EDC96DRAFT_550432 [Choanephora cucurbitarum]